MVSPRVLKLADQIKVIVGDMLQRRVKDPRLGFVTVTDVRLTGDTREATVFYTVLGESIDAPVDHAGTAAALKSATGIIRAQVGRQLGLRFTPTLAFVADAVPEVARELEGLLDSARSGDAELAARRAGAQYAGDADPYKKPHLDADLDDAGLDDAGLEDADLDVEGLDDGGRDIGADPGAGDR